MAKMTGLGKGLDALFGPAPEEEQIKENDSLKNLKITEVEPNRDQPRKRFDQEALEELASSIKEYGLIQPIVVTKKDGYYSIIAGERRWRASKIAGLKEIPAIIREDDEKINSEISLIENMQREDLNPVEKAMGIKTLIDNYGMSQEEVAKKLGKGRSTIANWVRVLNLEPRVLKMAKEGKISEGYCKALLAITDPEKQYQTAIQMLERGQTVRQVEKKAKVKETREDFEAQLEESLNKASTNEDAVWNRLEQMKEDGDVLALTVGGVVNGGVIVYVEGIRGFIPASLLSTKYVEDLNVWLQKDVEAKIITVEPEEQRLVLSAKAVEKEKERKERENKINELKVGTVVEGTVENIMPYGAFVDIGDGISGLVHISQLSQKRVKSPEEVVKEGDAVTVKIIKVANGKVSLSIKALEDDKEAAKKAEETGVEYTEDAAGTSLGDLLANIKL